LDHDAEVVIPKICQDDQADYEGELVCYQKPDTKHVLMHREKCLVIGKDAKDVPLEKALDYVAAYTAGNDISSRKLQRDPEYAGRIPQWGFSKGFDTFAPLGPCLVASEMIADPKKLHLKTTVDGQTRQDEGVSDLLFDCAYIVSYLSQGTTLQKGSVIMTGTPGGKFDLLEIYWRACSSISIGVGAGLKPPQYLTPGNEMHVWVSGIGTLRNGVKFA
jgi:2-keto-4-pentenoate hydratase/2-oxohepta-3-ene-1,7-dioic acid hydratase in catechol pathway